MLATPPALTGHICTGWTKITQVMPELQSVQAGQSIHTTLGAAVLQWSAVALCPWGCQPMNEGNFTKAIACVIYSSTPNTITRHCCSCKPPLTVWAKSQQHRFACVGRTYSSFTVIPGIPTAPLPSCLVNYLLPRLASQLSTMLSTLLRDSLTSSTLKYATVLPL
jgi:hypothetical protein